MATASAARFFGDKICFKIDGERLYVVGVTDCRIKMADVTDNKLEMWRTELLLRLSCKDTLRYGEFHQYNLYTLSFQYTILSKKLYITAILSKSP